MEITALILLVRLYTDKETAFLSSVHLRYSEFRCSFVGMLLNVYVINISY